MAEYREGQTATNPKTGQTIVFKGGQWVSAGSAAAPGGVLPQRKFSSQEQSELRFLSSNAENAKRHADEAAKAVAASRRLNTGPYRGAMLDTMIPHGGISNVTGTLIGGIPRALGSISNENVNDYQALQRAKNEGVLAAQIEQKGPQTESDAARMALTGVSTGNTPEQNQIVAAKIGDLAARAAARRDFKTQWANKYGVFGQNEQGQTADQGFDAMWEARKAGSAAKPKVTVRRIK